MAIAKVVFNGEVKIDVTQKTVSPENLLSGETALAANGLDIEGNIASKTSEDLILENSTVYVPAGFYATDASKYVPGGGGGGGTGIEPLTVTPTTNRQVFYASTQGYEGYSPVTVTAMPAGQAGAPIAEKGTVSNNTITITPSVTNTAGYIASETKTGNSISVTAAELVSGTLDIATNGEGIDVTNYAAVNVSVPSDNPNIERLNIPSLSENQQIFNAVDFQVDGFDPVVVPAIPNDYVGTGVPHWGSSGVGVTGPTVTIPAGYFSDDVIKTVTMGTLGTPTFNRINEPHSVILTPTITNPTIGYIDTETRSGDSIIISAADLVSGKYSITANGNYNITDYATVEVNVGGIFQEKININPTTASQTITPDDGYSALSSVQINPIPLGVTGVPIATKSEVSNNSIIVTPSVTNTTGYITGSTITGAGISVTAEELVSGTKTITVNGAGIDVQNYAFVDVNVTGGGGGFVDDVSILPSGGEYHEITGVEILGSITITENGIYDILQYASATINVANSGTFGSLNITPSEEEQIFSAQEYSLDGFNSVTVAPISSIYIGPDIPRRNVTDINISGANITIPSGYYDEVFTNVDIGSLGTPNFTRVDGNHFVKLTPYINSTAGYIDTESKTGNEITITASDLVSGDYSITANGQYNVTEYSTATVNISSRNKILTITPSLTQQTFDIINEDNYDGYNPITVAAMPRGEEGIPTNTIVTSADGHSKTITPTVSNTTGYITGNTAITGTPINISATDLVSGTKTITSNSIGIDVSEYAFVDVDVMGGGNGFVDDISILPNGGEYHNITGVEIFGSLTITENGIFDVTQYENVNVNINNAPTILPLNITPSTSTQIFDATLENADGYNTIIVAGMPLGSATIPLTTITTNPTITIDNSGLITSSYSSTQNITPTIVEGYITTGTAGNISTVGNSTYQLTTKPSTIYNVSTNDQTITPYVYLTGIQTIRKVITSGIDASSVKYGTTIKVGDEADDDRIIGVTGIFTDASTVSTGQTAATTAQILNGYSAWVNGSEIQGSVPTITLPVSTSSSPAEDYVNKAVIISGSNDQYINIPPGYNASGGYYKINSIPAGSISNLTVSQSTVSNNSVTITPIVEYTSGLFSSGTTSGNSISISASQLVSGTRNITSNGTFDITNYQNVSVNVSGGSSGDGGMIDRVSVLPTGGEYHEITAIVIEGNKTITANGQNIDVSHYATVDVNVQNTPNILALNITPTTEQQIFDATIEGAHGYNTVTVDAMPLGSATVSPTSITLNPTITVNSGGLVTASYSGSRNITPLITAGYIDSATAGTITFSGNATNQLSTQSTTTYNVSNNNQTIPSGIYLTGPQIFRGVITSGITAENIKTGTIIKVGDSDDDDRIITATGTFTSPSTVSLGQTAASANQIIAGYSAWVNGEEIKGSRIATTLSNTGTNGVTYNDISNSAPALISGGKLYINEGYTENWSINLSQLMPNDASPQLSGEHILNGYSAYNNDGLLISGTIPTKTDTNITVSGANVTIPSGYYATETIKTISSGLVNNPTATKGTVTNHSITVTPSVNYTSGYISAGTKTGSGVTITASELTSGTKSIVVNSSGIDVSNYAYVDVNVSGSGEDGVIDTVTILPNGGEYHEITAIVIDGTKTITANGTGIDVRQYATVDVNVVNTPNIIPLSIAPTTSIQTFDATLENADGYNTVTVAAMPSGSATTPTTTITANPTISISNSGLITASYSGSKSITPTITAGYIASGTAGVVSTSGSATQQLTTKAAATYNVSSSNQTIAAGQYLTGIQTIRGVTTSGISAANIKTGTIIKVGDAGDDDRITSVTGTFTASNTVSTGQTAANASKIISGYSAWVNGNEIKGSLTTTNFANEPTTGVTYTDISDAAPVLVSGSKLYISEGYTGNWSISLAKLVPDGASAQLAGTHILSGYSAYNNDGVLIAGTIPTKTATNVTVSGASVTIPAGYYNTEVTKTIGSGSVGTPTATKGTVSNHSITVTPSVSSTTGYISGGTKSGTGVVVTAAELVSDNKTITANGSNIDVTNFSTVTVNVQNAPTLLSLSVTPTTAQQKFIASEHNADGYSNVTVAAMPVMTLPTATQNTPTTGYSQKAIISRSTSDQYINIGTGYNSTGGYYKISATPNGSVTAPASISGTAATISASSGTITLTKTVAVTPNVTSAGYISSGTSGNSEITLSASANVKGADVYLPSNVDQSIIAANTYVNGIQTLRKVTTSGIITANIKAGAVAKVGCQVDDDNILNVTGTFTAASTVSTGQTAATANKLLSGYSAWVDGTEIKGSILSKNAATYYPSTTNQTIAANQYLSGTQTIKALTITNLTAENIAEGVTIKIGDEDDDDRIISITGTHKSGEGFVDEVTTLPGGGDYHAISGQKISGTLTITSNGTYDVSGYANVVVQI